MSELAEKYGSQSCRMFAYADKIFFPAVCTITTTWTNLTLYFHNYFYSSFKRT